jgi:hypothetical protein
VCRVSSTLCGGGGSTGAAIVGSAVFNPGDLTNVDLVVGDGGAGSVDWYVAGSSGDPSTATLIGGPVWALVGSAVRTAIGGNGGNRTTGGTNPGSGGTGFSSAGASASTDGGAGGTQGAGGWPWESAAGGDGGASGEDPDYIGAPGSNGSAPAAGGGGGGSSGNSLGGGTGGNGGAGAAGIAYLAFADFNFF